MERQTVPPESKSLYLPSTIAVALVERQVMFKWRCRTADGLIDINIYIYIE